MNNPLWTRLESWEPNSQGPAGVVRVIERNGDNYVFFVQLIGAETEISGDPDVLDYLEQRYTSPEVCFSCRNVLLQKELEEMEERDYER